MTLNYLIFSYRPVKARQSEVLFHIHTLHAIHKEGIFCEVWVGINGIAMSHLQSRFLFQ